MLDSTPVPFETFMRRALHDPEHGYYARRISGIGRSGDFTTAPMLSDLPGRAIARWAARALRETGCRNLIEMGPGEGRLAAAVWKALPLTVRWRTRLHLVESSEPLMERQRSHLGSSVRWHRDPLSAMKACGGRAVIFSNELLDAFPARLFERGEEGWREVAVSRDPSGRPVESLLPASPLPDSTVFLHPFPLRQRVEVHESLREWYKSWLSEWKAGRMLTIDYGSADALSLYHRRPSGTLRAYLLHQRREGLEIYENPGRQDITADINFADVGKWTGDSARSLRLEPLAAFIHRWTPSTLGNPLLDPDGPGGAFLVLEQQPVA